MTDFISGSEAYALSVDMMIRRVLKNILPQWSAFDQLENTEECNHVKVPQNHAIRTKKNY